VRGVLSEKVKTRLAGLLGIAVLTGAVGVTIGIYQKAFVDSVDVTVRAERAGLLLEKGAKVRIHGIQVGEVRAIEVGSDGGADVTIALYPDDAGRIPADVRADITPSTVFGAKYVDLLVPDGAITGAPIEAGDVIQAAHVTVEANDVFGQIQDLLITIDPAKLSQTLTALATALDGRGDQLGAYLSEVNGYVSALNGVRPELVSDIRRGSSVLDTYADVAPDLLAIGDQASVTTATLDEKSASLQALLVDFTAAAGSTDVFLRRIDDPLFAALDVMHPVLDSLEKFSPEFTCVLDALVKHRDAVNRILGLGEVPGIQGMVSLLPASQAYSYPDDVPKLIPDARPNCLSLPQLDLAKPPIRVFDDGSPGPDGSKGVDLTQPPAEIYLDLVEDYFGQTGLALLLEDIRNDNPPATSRTSG
jgi:phospholipid/cholesterol/gamma-HCH transport system substrate-binding protein